jgi:hypothetical protein
LPAFSPALPPLDLSGSHGSQLVPDSNRSNRSGDASRQPEQSSLRRSSSQRLRKTSFHAEAPSGQSAPLYMDEFRVPRPPTLSSATPSSFRPTSHIGGAPPSPRLGNHTGAQPARTIRRRDNFELPSPVDTSLSRTSRDFPPTASVDVLAGLPDDWDELGLPGPELFGLSAEAVALPEGLPWLPEPLFAEERTAVRSMVRCNPH